MTLIPTQDARNLFTKKLMAVYRERKAPSNFLRSFFPSVENGTKEISIQVMRGSEKIAVDVERGTEGNRNTFNKSSEKTIVPPYYREYFDKTELDAYEVLFGSEVIDDVVLANYINEIALKLQALQDKIERSYEKQCADVLTTGIVTLLKGTNIDFKRKAGSLVDLGGGSYWPNAVDLSNDALNPETTIFNAGNFIRQFGKTDASMLNVICGSSAISALLASPFIRDEKKILNLPLNSIAPPQRDASGGVFHGQISAKTYRANIWSYPEIYEDNAGNKSPYLDPTKIIVLPEKPNFALGFALVPQLIDEKNPVIQKGAYVIGEYKDERTYKYVQDIRSAGVAVPIAVDQIYTAKVTAA
ncbi:MAG TPA: major capsid protein [Cyclobacteriaceae bacterium]|jgi:hypothetical protein|nr:major capsid protein [Cyclobacteriaceae bacterium]